VLAKGGAKVLVLERAHFLGGMAPPGTVRRIQAQRRCLAVLIWRQEMTDRLELTKWASS